MPASPTRSSAVVDPRVTVGAVRRRSGRRPRPRFCANGQMREQVLILKQDRHRPLPRRQRRPDPARPTGSAPLIGAKNPAIADRSVDFPAPDGPMTAIRAPGCERTSRRSGGSRPAPAPGGQAAAWRPPAIKDPEQREAQRHQHSADGRRRVHPVGAHQLLHHQRQGRLTVPRQTARSPPDRPSTAPPRYPAPKPKRPRQPRQDQPAQAGPARQPQAVGQPAVVGLQRARFGQQQAVTEGQRQGRIDQHRDRQGQRSSGGAKGWISRNSPVPSTRPEAASGSIAASFDQRARRGGRRPAPAPGQPPWQAAPRSAQPATERTAAARPMPAGPPGPAAPRRTTAASGSEQEQRWPAISHTRPPNAASPAARAVASSRSRPAPNPAGAHEVQRQQGRQRTDGELAQRQPGRAAKIEVEPQRLIDRQLHRGCRGPPPSVSTTAKLVRQITR